MKNIELSRGMIALVDDEDYERVSQYSWYAYFAPNTTYARRRPWDKVNKRYLMESMHRFILNAPKGMEVDHIDGNGLNNVRKNLRLCTHQQNSLNHKIRKTSKSKQTGVSWDTQTKKWRATITFNKKFINLGRFSSFDEAVDTRKQKELQLFASFSR